MPWGKIELNLTCTVRRLSNCTNQMSIIIQNHFRMCCAFKSMHIKISLVLDSRIWVFNKSLQSIQQDSSTVCCTFYLLCWYRRLSFCCLWSKATCREVTKGQSIFCVLWAHSDCSLWMLFIHSFRIFLRNLLSPLLLRGAPDYSIDTVSNLTCQSATDNCEWRTCPRFLGGG